MTPRRIATAALALCAVLSGCGGGDGTAPTTTVALPSQTSTTATTTDGSSPADDPVAPEAPGPAENAQEDPRVNALERRARATVAAYIRAIDERDGERVCALLAPGAAAEIDFPRPAPGCPAAVDASLGYRDPRGLPVWSGSEATAVRVTELDGDHGTAKVIATVTTTYADRDEGSVEDDVVYLTRSGSGWLVAKPSATLYRAIGVADVPPTVLSPPG